MLHVLDAMGVSKGRRAEGGYRPSFLHRLLKPGVSGNTINGLGEARRRRPSSVYHRVEWTHPWSAVQNLFYWRTERDPVRAAPIVKGIELDQAPHDAIAPRKAEATASEWTRRVREFVLTRTNAKAVGIAAMNPEWVYTEIDASTIRQPWIVVLGVPMDYDELVKAPSVPAHKHVMDVYYETAVAARQLANWMRGEGFDAEGHGRAVSGKISMIPAAIEAGVGQLGKHGSIMNKELGSCFRLSIVLTDMPLIPDRPLDIGVDDFCASCRLCTEACPPKAIFDTKQLVRGVEKWYVDFDKCVPYFNDEYACGICLAVCPWSRPGVARALSEKMLKRRRTKESGASRPAA